MTGSVPPRDLDNICGTDAALRGRIEGLLRSHTKAGSFLHQQPVESGATADGGPLTEAAGTVIGRYKLLQPIGEGGFGIVGANKGRRPRGNIMANRAGA
jgi:hypothetical protein